MDLHVPALFPESYLANAHTRLVLYKRIASAASTEELEELQIETVDRFGLLPDQGKNLFRLTAIRLQCDKLGVQKLDVSESGGTIEFQDSPALDTMTILQLISDHPQRYQLGGPSVIKVIESHEDPLERLSAMEALVDDLVSSLDDPA